MYSTLFIIMQNKHATNIIIIYYEICTDFIEYYLQQLAIVAAKIMQQNFS